jgi:hypothetical protein
MGAREVIAEALEDSGMLLQLAAADDIIQALTAAGYAIVPVEPTEAMLRASARIPVKGPVSVAEAFWRAMLQAAPEAKGGEE